MKHINFLFVFSCLSLALFFGGCNSGIKYQKLDHSIRVQGDSINTEITIINEAIIHVKKQLNNHPAKEMPDFVTILKPQDVAWTVNKEDDQLIIATKKVSVNINSQGEISYHSAQGKELLSETSKGTFIHADTAADYRVGQAFTSGHEGLYGLGQYQSGRGNMKSVPVRMEQFNQEIAVPVVVSTNQYGLYWNNYSVTDFNLPEHEIELETVDKKLAIRKTTFTPKQSGTYNFFVLSETPFRNRKKGPANTNRRLGEVLLTLNSNTVIFYNTIWLPDSYSGEISLEAGKPYDIVFKNTGEQKKGRLLYNAPDYDKTTFSSKQGEAIDYYFVHAKNPVEVLSEYTRLTGRAPLFPKKSYGFWQCREAYHTQEELLQSAREYRKRNIPVDNIVQDWDYWPKGTKGPQWDRTRYPNPQAMTSELSALKINLMVSVWPTVYNKPLLEKYGLDQSILKATGFINFYDPTTQPKYYRMLSDSMFHMGVNSIWLDGSEPNAHPDPEQSTSVGKFKELSNTYALLVTKTMYEGHRKEFPDKRVFNLTRSAFAGQQRYGNSVWSGDVDGSWKQFAEQITAGTNFCMTGIPYWTTDIGGFFRWKPGEKRDFKAQYTSPEYRELLARWFQFGTFSPLFRIHGFRTETEIWKFGKEFESIARKFLDMRYQLMPYIYTEAQEVTQQGKILMSPLPYYFADDENTWDIKYQFMFGQSLMVCPVTKYRQRELKVYLPKGEWYDFWTNKKYQGGRYITASAELNSIPLFVRAGSILPWGPKLQYVDEVTDKPTVLKIYPGGDTQYTLYFDDEKSYDYEQGKYSEIEITYAEEKQLLTLKSDKDDFVNFSEHPKRFIIEMMDTGAKKEVVFDGGILKQKL